MKTGSSGNIIRNNRQKKVILNEKCSYRAKPQINRIPMQKEIYLKILNRKFKREGKSLSDVKKEKKTIRKLKLKKETLFCS